MEFILSHPSDPTSTATYGADEHGHPWVSLVYNDVPVRYYAAAPNYDVEWPVRGVLRVLATFGFVANDDVDAAFEWLLGSNYHDDNFSAGITGWPGRRGRAPGRGVRRVIETIENLRAAVG